MRTYALAPPRSRGQLRQINAGAIPFNPTQVAGMRLWFQADSVAGSDGASVSNWPDDSGNSLPALQAVAANQPVIKRAILTGHSIVRFDGVDDFMATVAPATMPSTFTVFTVARMNGGVGPQGFVNADTGVNAARKYSLGIGVGSSGRFLGFDTTGTLFADTEPTTPTEFRVYVGVRRAADIQAYLGTISNGATATTGTANASVLAHTVGRRDDAGGYLNGDIAEVIWYDTPLSTTNRENVTFYLGNKFGVSVT